MRITFLEEKMVWDLTVGELKELFFNESSTNRIKLSSNESPIFIPSKKTIEDFKEIATEEGLKLKKRNTPNTRKISLEMIKQIKQLAENGMTDKMIAEMINVSPQLIHYWRKNTPKELID